MLDLEVFSQNYLVRGLPKDQVAAIAELATLKRFMANDFVLRAGEKNADMFVIVEGRLNVFSPEGDRLAEVGPGSVLGEIALLDARPRSADAVCIGLVETAVFNARSLRSHLNQNRDTGFTILVNLAQVLCTRLRDANSRIDTLSEHAADSWKHAI